MAAADARLRESNRQVTELQLKCDELLRKCEAADKARQQVEVQLAAAEVSVQ